MDRNMMPCVGVSDSAGNHLCKVFFGRNTEIGHRQIQHCPSFVEIERSEITSRLVQAFVHCGKEHDHRNLLLAKSVIHFAMQIIGSERHGTPKETTW